MYSKDRGGLGIKDLRKQKNSLLLMKWLWTYNEEGQALWRNMIKCIYGEDTTGAVMLVLVLTELRSRGIL